MASSSASVALADHSSPGSDRPRRHQQDLPLPPPLSSSGPSASSPPWSHVVRGDPEGVIPSAELPPAAEANSADAEQSMLSDGQEDSASAVPAAPTNVNKPAWRRPANEAVAAGPVVMGAASWPALSESAKASPKSLPTSSAGSDAQKPLVNGSTNLVPAPSTKGSNSTTNQTVPVRQKSFKRGGGGGGSSSIGGAPTDGVAAQQTPLPQATSGVAAERPLTGPEPSPRDRPNKGNNNWDHGTRGGGGGGDHHRGYRRANNGGNGSHQNNNYGNRRDHERGSYDGNNRERGVHVQQRGSRPYNRPPPPPPPMAPPFMTLPPHARPFLNPVVYPDMPAPVVYIAPPPPESFRGFPFVSHPPAPPLPFFPIIDTQRSLLLNQIDYYFSHENLCKDLFLRKNMDEKGWVPLSLIAGFNRVKTLTDNMEYILDTVRFSTVVELQGEKIRKRNDWRKWTLTSTGNQFDAVSGPQYPANPDSDSLADHFKAVGFGASANQISMTVSPDTALALSRSASGNLDKQLLDTETLIEN